MQKFQYVGDYHTQVRLEKNGEKVKVREGEIVESDLDPKYFVGNGFRQVGEDQNEEEETPTLTVAQLKEKLTELNVPFEKKDTKAVLEAKLAEATKEETPTVTVTAEEDGKSEITLTVDSGEKAE